MIAVCHYGEIALKGDNRKFFEEKLVENIKKSLKSQGIIFDYVKRISGRILVGLAETAQPDKAKTALQKVFGIAYFAFAWECEKGIEKIKEKAVEILSKKEFATFKAEAKRSDKTFSLTSRQVNELVGEAILKIKKIKVSLENPDVVLFIEITEKQAFLYTEKIVGQGGLPLGIEGRAVCLISGGIDSPIAGFLMMKRGVEAVFLHLHSGPFVADSTIEKNKKLIDVLSAYQPKTKTYFAPFGQVQKEIFEKTSPELACVLCKRMMLRIAEAVAKKEKAKAIITGDSLGQVASQTLDNMAVISNAVAMPILRPLVAFDKIDAIKMARQIGTYDISVLPGEMYCSGKLPRHPATKSSLEKVENEEKKLEIEKLVGAALKNITIKN
ncbi:MAG: tRNA 4-thiouridine(8) synthase ThiI [Patescibacteria group bacterium]|nr:tRNA 4-thiouridine(8) synthase ThiI [Patescibacteria group bacterium]